MDKTPWTAFRDPEAKGNRIWRVKRNEIVAENALGKPRAFGDRKAASRAAEKLNDEYGIFVSGFIGVSEKDAMLVRDRLLAGDTLPEVRAHFRDSDNKLRFSMSQMRRMRDEVFAPLTSDPETIKALANGPMLNPTTIVRYRHPREEVAAGVKQIEMFS